ncbi:MAG: SURF1 family protein, partial [Dechloromonas sp.]|nr:SURF1 family protein [Dechloromonas sp.]
MAREKWRLQFDFEWRITLFVVLLAPFMVGLGFWQLERADEKAALAATFAARNVAPPAPLQTVWQAPAVELAYLPVRLQGEYLPGKVFLLDNRMHKGKPGYEVFSVLRLQGTEQVALVSRGWVRAPLDRTQLPEIPEMAGELT